MITAFVQQGTALGVSSLPQSVTSLAAQGPQGPPGAAGLAGQTVETIDRTADVVLSGHVVVRGTTSPGVALCDSGTPSHAQAFLGVTQGAASAGASVTVQRTGVLVEPSWSWTPLGAVYVGAAGSLTQTPPASGFMLHVGVALSATSLLIRPQPPIYL